MNPADTLADRVKALEDKLANLTVPDLPLAALQRKLENDWHPDHALLFGAGDSTQTLARGSFLASATSNISPGSGGVVFFPEVYDTANFYNPAIGRFQPTVPGDYLVGFRVRETSPPTWARAQLRKTTTGGVQTFLDGSFQTVNPGSSDMTAVLAFNGTTDYIEVIQNRSDAGGPLVVGDASASHSYFYAGPLA